MKKFTIILLALTTLLVACQANEENRLANKKQENALNENNTDDENVKKNASIEEQAKQMIYHVFKVGNMSMDDTIMNTYYDKKEKSISFTVKGRSSRPDDSSSTNFYKDTVEAFRQLASLKDLSWISLGITLPTEDVYGYEDELEVMSTWMSRQTMDEIDWETFDHEQLLDLADGMVVCPRLDWEKIFKTDKDKATASNGCK